MKNDNLANLIANSKQIECIHAFKGKIILDFIF